MIEYEATHEEVENNIAEEYYFNVGQMAQIASYDYHDSLDGTMLCVIVLKCGVTFSGSCYFHGQKYYDAQIGKSLARDVTIKKAKKFIERLSRNNRSKVVTDRRDKVVVEVESMRP